MRIMHAAAQFMLNWLTSRTLARLAAECILQAETWLQVPSESMPSKAPPKEGVPRLTLGLVHVLHEHLDQIGHCLLWSVQQVCDGNTHF